MPYQSERAQALAWIASDITKNGNVIAAKQIYHDALNSALEINRSFDCLDILRVVGVESAHAGNIAFAKDVLEKAIFVETKLTVEDKRSSDSIDRIYSAIAVAHAKIDDLSGTLHFTDRIRRAPQKIQSLFDAAEEFAKLGKFSIARFLLHRVDSLYPNSRKQGNVL